MVANPSPMFACKEGAYPRLEYLKGAPLLGGLLTLPTNIRLNWEGLLGTNTLA
jgi:hypothetical protein